MTEKLRPPVPAKDYEHAVVKWRDGYFIERRGSWYPVQLKSPDEVGALEERTSAGLGIGVALVLSPFVVWGVGALSGLNERFLREMGMDVLAPVAFWLLIIVGCGFVVAGFIGRLRLGREVAVAENGTLWGVAQQLSGQRSLVDLDLAQP